MALTDWCWLRYVVGGWLFLQTGLSKGYCFAYFMSVEEATAARDALNGTVIEGRQARVDYSRTTRPHSPTPGQYMGREDQVTDMRSLRRR